MRLAILSAVTLLSTLSFVACGSSDHGGSGTPVTDTPGTVPAVTDTASFCGAMCSREQSCDQSLDKQTCENQCMNTNAAVFPRLRKEIVNLIVGCFGGKDCKTVLGGGFVGACTADAIASVAPSAAASSLCDALSTAKKTCSGAGPTTKADCLNSAKLYGDAAIDQAQNCVKRGCSEIDACVSAAFGSLGGMTTPKAGGSCSGRFTDLGSCEACAETSCCSETAACEADSACRTILQACVVGGTGSSPDCNRAYTKAPSSSQNLASTVFGCSSSKCSGGSTCNFGG